MHQTQYHTDKMNGLRATLNENETMNLVDNDQVKMTIKTLHKPDIEETFARQTEKDIHEKLN